MQIYGLLQDLYTDLYLVTARTFGLGCNKIHGPFLQITSGSSSKLFLVTAFGCDLDRLVAVRIEVLKLSVHLDTALNTSYYYIIISRERQVTLLLYTNSFYQGQHIAAKNGLFGQFYCRCCIFFRMESVIRRKKKTEAVQIIRRQNMRL